MCLTKIFDLLSSNMFYEKNKTEYVMSRSLALFYRVIQLIVILYIIVYVMVLCHEYQEEEIGSSSTLVNIQGSAPVVIKNVKGRFQLISEDAVNDALDLQMFSDIPDGFFIATSFIVVEEQKQTNCMNMKAPCTSNSSCPKDAISAFGQGINTGRCLPLNEGSTHTFCEVLAWCPLGYPENERKSYIGDDKLTYHRNFSVVIQNHVSFRDFRTSENNIPQNQTYLEECINSTPAMVGTCPRFSLNAFLEPFQKNFENISEKGAIFNIFIDWNCNLDLKSRCFPTYDYQRVDFIDEDSDFGYELRNAVYFTDNKIKKRKLTIVNGIRFNIITRATARKFSIVYLFLNIGAGLGLLGLATEACDLIVDYFMDDSNISQENPSKHSLNNVSSGNEDSLYL